MPRTVEYLAREIARKAGYDPDQIVIEIDKERDFDYHTIGVAPVDISKLHPVFLDFIAEAQERMRKEVNERVF